MPDQLVKRVDAAIAYIQKLDLEKIPDGKYIVDDNFFYMVQTFQTKQPEETCYEAHQNYVDIQYIVSGQERMQTASLGDLTVKVPYDPQKDIAFYEVISQAATMTFTAGGYGVFYPQDAHRPGMCVDTPDTVKKVVGKVRV
ncbi:MAG: YhcH/YjgK/YiaL family protein [Lachnospiraceae bacterium]|nr:YhcH/YjgK/YiaL family protein [Lachnospiraceae bacterium]